MKLRRRLAPIATLLLSLVLAGCAAEPEAPRADDAPIGTTQQAYFFNGRNCTWREDEGRTANCENRRPEIDINQGSFVAIHGLSAWKNEKVWVANEGPVAVTLFVSQGFNRNEYYTTIEPGERAVMHRIDEVWPLYALLFDVPAGTPWWTAKIRVDVVGG